MWRKQIRLQIWLEKVLGLDSAPVLAMSFPVISNRKITVNWEAFGRSSSCKFNAILVESENLWICRTVILSGVISLIWFRRIWVVLDMLPERQIGVRMRSV